MNSTKITILKVYERVPQFFNNIKPQKNKHENKLTLNRYQLYQVLLESVTCMLLDADIETHQILYN